jgi:DNA (cytosine-5)-methyltransferase 1
MKLKLLDLFSGIGGFSLGLERSGAFETVAFCEREPFCQHIIKKHWPGVPIYDDVETLTASRLAADGVPVDAICGGFPCQDISLAGAGAGLDGKRSGLWWQFHRLIEETRPSWVIIENVSALRSRGLDRVLGSLAEIGYDAEWHCIPASAFGAPHQRDRIWIVAYPDSAQRERGRVPGGAYAQHPDVSRSSWWQTEPGVDRVAYGVPAWTHRLRALGNAVVPQIPQAIGEMISARIARR